MIHQNLRAFCCILLCCSFQHVVLADNKNASFYDVVVVELFSKPPSEISYNTTTQVEPTYVHTELAMTEGVVQSIMEEGSKFNKDASLLSIDLEQTRLQLEALDSNLSYYRAKVSVLSGQLERYQHLLATKMINKEAIELAQLDMYKAKNEFAQTENKIKSLEWVLDQSKHLAEFDGIVSKRHVSVGATLSKGAPLLEIVSTNQRRIVFELPSNLVYQPIDVVLHHQGQSYTLPDYKIIPKSHNRSILFQVNADVSKLNVKIGELVAVVVNPKNQQYVYSIPRAAILEEGNSKSVYIVNAKNITHRQSVDIVDQSASKYLVSSEHLSEGDLVIVSASSLLKDGQVVTVKRLENETK